MHRCDISEPPPVSNLEVTTVDDSPKAAGLPNSARAVLIGAGIVGNSLAHHLARLGWTDLVLIDKGPLPNPGGSTGHASNFIYPVDHSKEMTALTLDSMRQYDGARRAHHLRGHRGRRAPRSGWRSCAGACPRPPSWGVEQVSLVTPGRDQGARALHRRERDHRRLLLARAWPWWTRCAPARSCASARQEAGALTVSANTEVLGIDVEGGRVSRVRTDARRHRGGVRGDLLRRVEPAPGAHGRSLHPAHPRRSPDDRHRPGAALRRGEERHRIPDRARHGHEHVRAPGRQRARGGLVRPPADPARPRRDPLGRGGRPLAHRATRSPRTTSSSRCSTPSS